MGYANWVDGREEITFTLTGAEFVDHCRNRAKFHEERYKVLKAQEDRLAVELKDFMQTTTAPASVAGTSGAVQGFFGATGTGPVSGQIGMMHLASGAIGGFSSAVKSSVDNLTQLRQKHQNLMQLFSFSIDHLRDEKYRLTEGELRKWEFID